MGASIALVTKRIRQYPTLLSGNLGNRRVSFQVYCRVPNFIIQFPTLLSEYTRGKISDGLLHRHAFGEVARLVHIAAARDGNVIGEQLQRDDREQREQRLQRLRQEDHVLDF